MSLCVPCRLITRSWRFICIRYCIIYLDLSQVPELLKACSQEGATSALACARSSHADADMDLCADTGTAAWHMLCTAHVSAVRDRKLSVMDGVLENQRKR